MTSVKGIVLGAAASMVVAGVAACGPVAVTTHAPAAQVLAARSTDNPQAQVSSRSAAATPSVAPPQVVVLASQPDPHNNFTIQLVDTGGAMLASVSVTDNTNGTSQWSISAAGRAAYWVSGSAIHRLDASGSVATLASVPGNESGRVLVSPDGTQWVYPTMSEDANGVVTNDLWLGSPATAARLIAHRVVDPQHPVPGEPSSWQYLLKDWTPHGILAIRQPLGGCGCGPFDMQMSASYSILLDPKTGNATDLTSDGACPLSGAGAAGIAACFHSNSTGGSDAIEFSRSGKVLSRVALSGKNLGGDATFKSDGSIVAYATVAAGVGCGDDYAPTMTLHVMDVASGDATVVGSPGLEPFGWLHNGKILATQWKSLADGNDSSATVVVDATSGAVNTISNSGDRIVAFS